jgi:hypothetical protein
MSDLERAFTEWLWKKGLVFKATEAMFSAFEAGVEWRSESLAIQGAENAIYGIHDRVYTTPDGQL